MAISRVVPVTGSGGGMTASPQGRSVHPQPTLNKYPIQQSGAGAFTEAFSPYLQMAMKKSQAQQRNTALANALQSDDPNALLKTGPRGYSFPEQYIESQTLQMKYQELKEKRLSREATEKWRNSMTIQKEGMRGGTATDIANIGAKSKLAVQAAKTEGGKTLLTLGGTIKDRHIALQGQVDLANIGARFSSSSSLLSQKGQQAMTLQDALYSSKEAMQEANNIWKDGQNGSDRELKKALRQMDADLAIKLQSDKTLGQMDIVDLKANHDAKKQGLIRLHQHALKDKDGNLARYLGNEANATKKEVADINAASREFVTKLTNINKTEIAHFTAGEKRWEVELKEENKTRNIGVYAHFQEKLQAHAGNVKGGLMKVQHGLNVQRDGLNNEFTNLQRQLEFADKTEMVSIKAGIAQNVAQQKLLDMKEMAATNYGYKEDITLLQKRLDRETKLEVQELKNVGLKIDQGQKLGVSNQRIAAKLRDQFSASTKSFRENVQPAYIQMKTALSNRSPAGDKMALLAFAQMAMPNKKDMNLRTLNKLENLSGLPGMIRSFISMVFDKKEKMSPGARKDLAMRTEEMFLAHQKSYHQSLEGYRSLSRDAGIGAGERQNYGIIDPLGVSGFGEYGEDADFSTPPGTVTQSFGMGGNIGKGADNILKYWNAEGAEGAVTGQIPSAPEYDPSQFKILN